MSEHLNDGLNGLSKAVKERRKDDLLLNVYATWFKLLAEGVKTEDYRDLTEYWHRRLHGRTYKTVTIRNGFDPLAPEAVFEFAGVEIGTGRTEWGAPGGKTMYIIKLGRLVSLENFGRKPQKDTNAADAADKCANGNCSLRLFCVRFVVCHGLAEVHKYPRHSCRKGHCDQYVPRGTHIIEAAKA